MLRTSLIFLAIAGICLLFADLAVTTLHPWGELGRMATGALTPDLSVLYTFRSALLNTLVFAFCGIALGVVFGSVLAYGFHLTPVRLFCAFIRAVHEIFWAFLFLPLIGLNPICGVLAIGVPYAGIFAKVYAEIFQETDPRPLHGLPNNTDRISRLLYGYLPGTWNALKHYTSYRFECALRSSTVLGFIGLPTLGFHLETAFREGLYAEAAALLFAFYLLIGSLRYWLKPRLVPVYIFLAFFLISKTTHISWSNITRFLTYDIVPWPMRRQGFLNGTHELTLPLNDLWTWFATLFTESALPGIWNTFLLTQIVLVGTGLFALLVFPFISHHFTSRLTTRLGHYGLIVLRTTPEYILAYILVQLWGPSMLPAIVAIALHNGAILAFLTGQNTNLIHLRLDQPQKRTARYLFEILPRVYRQFLAFLFYRWEVMMRESAILGILGIYTLGFFIDSAIAENKMDRAVLLILITALMNTGIDTISQKVRKHLRLSAGTVKTVR
ncbi:MAG: ABC transporter permease [bacterium]|nr:ABC transporter permease [bacterium]